MSARKKPLNIFNWKARDGRSGTVTALSFDEAMDEILESLGEKPKRFEKRVVIEQTTYRSARYWCVSNDRKTNYHMTVNYLGKDTL